MKKIQILLAAVAFCVSSTYANQQSVASNQVFSAKNYMTLVFDQESNGKKGFKLQYAKPKSPVSESKQTLGGFETLIKKYDFEKGQQTLLFLIEAKKGKEKRRLLVLYSGLLSYMAGTEGFYFYLAEEYEKSIRYYAMFNSEPSLAEVTMVAEQALANPDSALIATKWAGKESEIFIYDGDRLQK